MNRITSGSDYQGVVRRGVRRVGAHTVIYVRKNSAVPTGAEGIPARFGFIVAKNVGNAVRRNSLRRRLKAGSYELLATVEPGTDIVVRALPTAKDAAWATLRTELAHAFEQSLQVRKVSSKR
ncbi:ribonuclease P protein component [Cryobacterium roopkundense]|uniref:ribonuclease P protein component n=1 Tax=Cryobacterium roopkundense TaxID=1001240 RepID=UPI003B8375D0